MTPRCAASASAGVSWPPRSRRCAYASARRACWRRITAPPAGLPSICRKVPVWCSPRNESRWVNIPEPAAAQLSGKLLYVDEARPGGRPYLQDAFARVEPVAEFTRKRGTAHHRDLRDRSAPGPEGRGARAQPAAGIRVATRAGPQSRHFGGGETTRRARTDADLDPVDVTPEARGTHWYPKSNSRRNRRKSGLSGTRRQA